MLALAWYKYVFSVNSEYKNIMDKQDIAVAEKWFEEFWEKGNASIVDELAIDKVLLCYPLTGKLSGKEALKEKILAFHRVFTRSHFELVDKCVGDDKVVARWQASATYTGKFGDLPEAKDKKIKFSGISILQIVDGKVVVDRGEEDRLAILQQIASQTVP
ncbi:hypothetical protein CCS41_11420 [Candidatus Fukatsuia symbiotica]|uniref:SnoaL-like domain-containing protein n=2 Tax=Yersiniaceae TaxID=1903411 RepID=A0A2U8I706_9GAMM|nr:hypothetical protein CCS41_11420 [Candidatus Fukatsuia symbiotica]